jgi:hypothetical protein
LQVERVVTLTLALVRAVVPVVVELEHLVQAARQHQDKAMPVRGHPEDSVVVVVELDKLVNR